MGGGVSTDLRNFLGFVIFSGTEPLLKSESDCMEIHFVPLREYLSITVRNTNRLTLFRETSVLSLRLTRNI
jgi:hypothetical protein